MRYILLFVSMLLSSLCAVGATPADALLSRVVASINDYNPYKVNAEVIYGYDSIEVDYHVSGDAYYMSIGNQELYGDSKVKYEVYNSRKEVVIDVVSTDEGNLLDNPATVFDSLSTIFKPTVISENQEFVELELKPIEGAENSIDAIVITVSKATNLPTKLIYQMMGDEVEITINSIERSESTIPLYDSVQYADYDVIDFR